MVTIVEMHMILDVCVGLGNSMHSVKIFLHKLLVKYLIISDGHNSVTDTESQL